MYADEGGTGSAAGAAQASTSTRRQRARLRDQRKPTASAATTHGGQPGVFDIYGADATPASTSELEDSSATLGPTEYISVQQAVQSLLAAPRFIPMAVPAGQPALELETALEESRTEVGILRTELQLARTELTSSDLVVEEVTQGSRRLRAQLAERAESISEISTTVAEVEQRANSETEAAQAKDSVIDDLRKRLRLLRSEREESLATENLEVTTLRNAEHTQQQHVNVLKHNLSVALEARRHHIHEFQMEKEQNKMLGIELRMEKVRLETAAESSEISAVHQRWLLADNEMLYEQVALHLQQAPDHPSASSTG